MRFLILTQYFPPEVGAPQVRLAAMAAQLRARGHDVEVVTAMPHHLVGSVFAGYRRRFYMRDRWEDVTVHRTWVYAASGTGARRLLNYASFATTSLWGLARARRPDYVFVESPPLFLSLPAWLYAAFRRSKIIFNVSDLWPDSVRDLGAVRDGPVLRLAEALERWSYAKARVVNAMTETARKTLIVQKGVPAKKVLLLPNGVDSALFAPRDPDEELARELGVADKKVFLFAGTHGAAQGLENIVEAAALLRDTEICFVLVGDGYVKPALVRAAKERGLKNIVFVEPRPLTEMPRYFSIACASVVPLVAGEALKSARPSKIFPSLSAGVPVLFSGEGDAADLVAQSGGGVVVPPADPQAIADAALGLARDEQRRQEMARRGRQFVEERYSWSTLVAAWLDQLRRSEAARAGSTT